MADIAQDIETEGVAALFTADAVKDSEPQVYEVGYHLLPSLSEQEVTATVKDLMNFLKKEGASLVGEQAPQMVDLAYSIERRVNGKFVGVRTAYFGWVAFELSPAAIGTVNQFIDTNPAVLRHIVITTTKDEVKAVQEGKVIMPTAVASTDAIAAPKRSTEEGGEVSQVDLDKALDSMTDEKEA